MPPWLDRNALCWCESCGKYKHYHLMIDEGSPVPVRHVWDLEESSKIWQYSTWNIS
jgi:hypothetical protein